MIRHFGGLNVNGLEPETDGQSSVQGVRNQRDSVGVDAERVTKEEHYTHADGQEKCKISAIRVMEKLNIRKTDTALQVVIYRWDSLSEAIRLAITAMVRTTE